MNSYETTAVLPEDKETAVIEAAEEDQFAAQKREGYKLMSPEEKAQFQESYLNLVNKGLKEGVLEWDNRFQGFIKHLHEQGFEDDYLRKTELFHVIIGSTLIKGQPIVGADVAQGQIAEFIKTGTWEGGPKPLE